MGSHAASSGSTTPVARIPCVVSIGYEGQSADEIVRCLAQKSVDTLVDVRKNAISRKPGLSKTRLRTLLAEHGVEYVHLPALGNPKENRAGFQAKDPSLAHERFRSLLAEPSGRAGLDDLARLASNGHVAVLCFERDPRECHRTIVIEELQNLMISRMVEFTD